MYENLAILAVFIFLYSISSGFLERTPINGALIFTAFGLEDIINRHEKQIKEANLSEQESQNLSRLMGSYQGLSHALISYASTAEQIDWKHWEEEVFS